MIPRSRKCCAFPAKDSNRNGAPLTIGHFSPSRVPPIDLFSASVFPLGRFGADAGFPGGETVRGQKPLRSSELGRSGGRHRQRSEVRRPVFLPRPVSGATPEKGRGA